MQTRVLGNNGPDLTVIGFGAWAIGGPWTYGWGQVDDNESVEAIRRAVDKGVNWIDTAAAYGFGHSEEVIGRAMKKMKKNVFVATKCGLVPDGRGDAVRNSRPESLRKELEASLKRLKVDCIDLYQIHWPDASVPYEESWGAMVRFQDEGKVRFIGVSNYEVSMLEKCRTIAPVQSLQPPYSMLTRDIEKEILPYCRNHGIGVVVYSPMQSGLLSGRFDISKLAADDWRRKFFWFQEPYRSQALRLVEQLRPIAARYKKTVGQFAIAWVLHHPSVTSAIVGARRPGQVDENIDAADLAPDKADMNRIDELLQEDF